MNIKKPTRREFLFASAASVVGVVLAACTTPSPSTPTTIPPATAVPAASDTPAATPAEPITPTPIATQAATATSVPTSAAVSKESPLLAQLVKDGKLPPLDQRLPKVPLTLSPVDGIGKYGGRLRSFWGASWSGYFQESQYGHSPLRFIDDGLGIAPGIMDTWSTNADNSVWTMHMREGLKWSDGQPCTVDDILFVWNDVTQATDASQPDTVPEYCRDANGKLVTLTKVDDYTLTMTYGTPAPLIAELLAMWVKAGMGSRWIAPMHYLKQFHPKYNTAEKDFKDFNTKAETWTNPDCPVLNSWILTKLDAGKSLTGERNPYYYAVDTEGNQLPYIDGLDWINIPSADPQVEILQIKQGTIDFQFFHDYTLGDISILKDNQDAGNYNLELLDSGDGSGMMYFWNYDAADDKLRSLYRTPEFKQAMSFAIDRPTIQHTIYFDTGMQTTGTPSPKAYEFNFNADAQAFFKKARDIYVAYDPEKAKSLLDKIGCKVGSDGHRTYPDGTPLTVSVDVPGDASKECMSVLEITRKNWGDVGLNVVVNTVTPTAFETQWEAGKLTFHTNWGVGNGPDLMLDPSWIVPNDPQFWAPLCSGVIRYAGTPLEATQADMSPWARNPPRFNKNDKDFKGTPIEKIDALYAQAIIEPDKTKRTTLVWAMWQIHMDMGPFLLGTVANTPQPVIVSRKLTNVPTRDQLKTGGYVNPWIIPFPAVTNPETYAYK